MSVKIKGFMLIYLGVSPNIKTLIIEHRFRTTFAFKNHQMKHFMILNSNSSESVEMQPLQLHLHKGLTLYGKYITFKPHLSIYISIT